MVQSGYFCDIFCDILCRTGFGGTCLSGECQAAGALDTAEVRSFIRTSDSLPFPT